MEFDPLILPISSFSAILSQIKDDAEVRQLLMREKAGQNRNSFVKTMEDRLAETVVDEDNTDQAGITPVADEEDGAIILEEGKAWVIEDGKKVPYTSNDRDPDAEAAIQEPQTPEQKQRVLDLI